MRTARSVVTRRSALGHLLAGVATFLPLRPLIARVPSGSPTRLSDGVLGIEIDASMDVRLSFAGRHVTGFDRAEELHRLGGERIDRFIFLGHRSMPVTGPHGRGTRHVLSAAVPAEIEMERSITFFDRYPGLALLETSYRNVTAQPVTLSGWQVAGHLLSGHVGETMFSFAGASYPDRRDWIRPVTPNFDQRNFMGMNGADYGGGTPVAVVWRRDVGLAVGHLDTVPRLVSLPVTARAGGTSIALKGDALTTLAPGAVLTLPTSFVMVHAGDHFRPLDAYRRLMAERGIAAAAVPASSYGPIWCAWGYEHNYTPDQVVGTLPKARALGFEWAVLDDGWQRAEGDWRLDPVKYPRGDADMKAFVARIKAAGMRPRLWLAPLAADPGTDLLRDHADMLLLDDKGAKQKISWWDAYTLCPAYQPTIDYFRGIVRRIIGEWGYEGLKLDGQHLNGVAPCHNPAHHHARPEESYEKLQDFWQAIYDEARSINPNAVVELCPCGDSFAFHNLPATNNTPASDPLSSWQVRLKGKTFKALMGPSAPYSGDHVELSDHGDDFASTYGVGGIPSTKFTWPRDADLPAGKLPPGGFVLTPAKEELWAKWISLYQANRLAEGTYLGGLYDIGFDKPEGHAVARGRTIHYAFYADRWDGPVTLRGLGNERYALTDAFTGHALGTASAAQPTIAATFRRFLLVRAEPVGATA